MIFWCLGGSWDHFFVICWCLGGVLGRVWRLGGSLGGQSGQTWSIARLGWTTLGTILDHFFDEQLIYFCVVFCMPFWMPVLMIVDGFGTTFWRFSDNFCSIFF